MDGTARLLFSFWSPETSTQARLTSTTPAGYQEPNFISLPADKGSFYPEQSSFEFAMTAELKK